MAHKFRMGGDDKQEIIYMALYRIRTNFQGTQFSQIAISKHFTQTIFSNQEFRVHGILNFVSLVLAECAIGIH